MTKLIGLTIAGLTLITSSGFAGELIYSPVNPSFGGSPLNSAHLLGLASAQRESTASDFKKPTTATGTNPGGTSTSDADLFVRQLQGRLLSALAAQVTDAIFGENPQENGTVQFGDTTVTFDRTGGSIRLTIVNAADGTVTEIVVPQLVTNGNAALTAGSAPNSVARTAGTSSSAAAITGTLSGSNASGIY